MTASLLADLVADLPAVDLMTLNARAELLTRVDRKYLVHVDLLPSLLDRLGGDVEVLEIAGRRLLGYSSTYVDTPDFALYRAHLQGRRRRYKVRLRTYLDSDLHFLEVKHKAYRGSTVKRRTEWETPVLEGDHWQEYARWIVRDAYRSDLPAALSPVATVTNRRCTFAFPGHQARMTIDVDLRFTDPTGSAGMRADRVLVETKSGPRQANPADRALRDLGMRPVSISKYCAAVALLHSEIRSNPWRHLLRQHFESVALAA